MIKCTEDEKAFLFAKYGEDRIKDLPWWDIQLDEDISGIMHCLTVEGLTPDQNHITELGAKYELMYDSLCYQNSAFKGILDVLKENMDKSKFDPKIISPEALGVSSKERDGALVSLAKQKLISGVSLDYASDGKKATVREIGNVAVTLGGLEYLKRLDEELVQESSKYARELLETIR